MMQYPLPSLLLSGLVLMGCAPLQTAPPQTPNAPSYAAAAQHPFLHSSRAAIDELLKTWDIHQLEQSPVLVATIVNINRLNHSAPLGRTLSEIYASQLASKGLNVKEMKLRGAVYVKEGAGELLLSREIRDIASQHSAAVVLVGTYSPAARYTYISLKLVRTADSRIMRSYDYALPNDRDVQQLLIGSSPP